MIAVASGQQVMMQHGKSISPVELIEPGRCRSCNREGLWWARWATKPKHGYLLVVPPVEGEDDLAAAFRGLPTSQGVERKGETMKADPIVMISKAPEDPEEKRQWAYHMMRIQVAMWLDDGTCCAECRNPYTGVDDFLARNPRCGLGFGKRGRDDWFVDDACFEAYAQRTGAPHK